MASIQNCNLGKKKIQVSFIIRDDTEKLNRSGINSLQYDPLLSRLYTAGRDSVIRIWNTKTQKDPYMLSMEHHVDWVNDIVLCCGGRHLISASSDSTVKVWNAHKGFCMSTLRTHRDYVKALAYAKDKEQVASAGLDRAVFIWDINTLTALTSSNNTITTSSLNGSKSSIYSLVMNSSGTILLSGSTEKNIRAWDPRTCAKLFKLKDNIRALLLSRDGMLCLSGSSDGSIRLWSLGQQRCLLTLWVHSEGIWTLQANESFNKVISGGRDGKVLMTDLKEPHHSVLLIHENSPVLKMLLTPDGNHLWVATSNSSIQCWNIGNVWKNFNDFSNSNLMQPFCTKPENIIHGGPSIIKYCILNDKRHLLAKDSDGNVSLYDAQKCEELGKVNLEEEVQKRFRLLFVPSWFSVDLRTGMICIHLAQDENDCFSAWVSSQEIESVTDTNVDQKVNYGSLLLQALLEYWPPTFVEDKNENDLELCSGDHQKIIVNSYKKRKGNGFYSIPSHTPVIFSEVGGRTLYRLLCRDAGGEAEQMLLAEMIPSWVIEIVIDKGTPRFIKIPFYLLPHSSYLTKTLKKDRLIANDFIQMKKVCEYVWEKLLRSGSDLESNIGQFNNDGVKNESILAPEEKIELLCQEQILSINMDLRTVRHFMWKSSSDLILHYRIINNQN